MSDAFQCDRCDDYYGGTGHPVRHGVYTGTSGFQSNYDFEYTAELCDDCKSKLDDLIDEFRGDD